MGPDDFPEEMDFIPLVMPLIESGCFGCPHILYNCICH